MDLSNHWDHVHQGWRHIVSELPQEKQDRIITNYEELILPYINTEEIETSMDWGCGGGLLTKELKKFSDTIAVDLCKDSLDNCQQYAQPDFLYQLPSSLWNFDYNGPRPDFILAHAVVWHFPSLDYFHEAIDVWTELQPTYIAFNTKTGENRITSDYQSNFLHALILNDDYVVESLKGFRLVNKAKGRTKTLEQTYFVFKQI